MSKTRLKEIFQKARDEFWHVVAMELPECKSGDMTPDQMWEIDLAMERAITQWYENNRTDKNSGLVYPEQNK